MSPFCRDPKFAAGKACLAGYDPRSPLQVEEEHGQPDLGRRFPSKLGKAQTDFIATWNAGQQIAARSYTTSCP